MHISRKTNQELVVLDSSIWVSVLLLCAGGATAYASMMQGKPKGLWITGFFALFAFLFWRKEVVTFDSGRQQAAWWRRRAFKSASGTVAFSEITGVGMEVSAAGGNNAMTYRLTILTKDQRIGMSDVYSGDRMHYEELKKEIAEFLHVEAVGGPASDDADANSLQSLLKQGRKVDAIALVRASQHIGLTEAVDVVNRIDEKMKASK